MDAVSKAIPKPRRFPQDGQGKRQYPKERVAFIRMLDGTSGMGLDGEQYQVLAGTTGSVIFEACDGWPGRLLAEVTLAFGPNGPIRDIELAVPMRACSLDWLRPG